MREIVKEGMRWRRRKRDECVRTIFISGLLADQFKSWISAQQLLALIKSLFHYLFSLSIYRVFSLIICSVGLQKGSMVSEEEKKKKKKGSFFMFVDLIERVIYEMNTIVKTANLFIKRFYTLLLYKCKLVLFF